MNRSITIPSEPEHVWSLDGTWRFKLEQAVPDKDQRDTNWEMIAPILTPESFESFFALDYREDGDWHDMEVPCNWEMLGYSPATYDNPDNASGFYRKWFEVPASWEGRRVLVNFDGVQNGAEVWLNGQPVDVAEPSWGRANYHESGWTAWQADLTAHVRFGEKNLLALRVTKNTKSACLDSGDFFFLGGIYRPVTLFSVPQAHIEDITITTTLLQGNQAEVKVVAEVSGRTGTISMRLGDLDAVTAPVNSGGIAELVRVVEEPRLWSAEHPNLCPLTVELADSRGEIIETVSRRVGIREVRIKDGVYMVNGVPVKITGMCRHDVDLTHGSAVGEDLWRRDLELMRAANVNSVRTSHYPYGAGFYDLCDEMGFYVLDEIPACWCETNDPSLEPAFLQRARETIARDKNHACVVMWGIGNENVRGQNLQKVADLVEELDPTRPRLVSCQPADVYGVEIDDDHYIRPEIISQHAQDRERRARWPFLYSECPNIWDVRYAADFGALDLWAAVIDRTWEVTWPEDGLMGHHTWEWQDRAVADRCPTKLYNYEPATGVQYLKAKGIVDGNRNPRPEYYHMKMAHTPIKLEPRADLTSKPGCVVLDAWNRYSFTDLKELTAEWTLLDGGAKLASGIEHFDLAPRTRGRLELALPQGVSADALRIDFSHADGLNIVSYQFGLKESEPQTPPTMSTNLPEALKFPRLNLVCNVTNAWTTRWKPPTRFRCCLSNIRCDPAITADLYDQRLADVRMLKAEIVGDWAPTPIVGRVRAEYADGRFSYRIDWTGRKADIQELGWTFEMPHQYDRFSWSRRAHWSVYPEDHIGRPMGTATPDSADVPLMIVTRPDAHDFDSTKYDCDWVSLTDADGRGLRVVFDPGQRHQCKGGFGLDGAYRLVVNRQCSPPRDISSSVVPDMYLELDKDGSIEGSFCVGSE